MSSWFERLPIRTRIIVLVLTILLPVAAILAWFLAADLTHAREAAHAKVRILAIDTAANLDRFLRQNEAILGRLAARPLVKALDPDHCDPIFADYLSLHSEFRTLGLRDRQANIVCSFLPRPPDADRLAKFPWIAEALRSEGFAVTDAVLGGQSGRWISVLTHPVRDDTGARTGMLALTVDLLSLNQQLLASTPKNAIVSVVDRERAIVLRSADAESFIGKRPNPNEPDPLGGQHEGFLSSTGRDGVPRLVAFVTIPGVEWRVVAGLPEAEVFAEYNATLRRTVGIGLGVLLMALGLAWRLSAAITKPIADLARTAAGVAAGDTAARAKIAGSAEIESVAHQFNRMLDARDRSEAALHQSENRYRTLIDWSPEAISVHRDGKLLFVNQAAVELVGATSAQDLVGKSSLDFVHPDDRHVVLGRVKDATDHDTAVPMLEEKFVRLDGTLVDVEVQGIPIVFGGEPAILASMRDITARKQTELALRLSEARLRGIFDSATDAILTADEAQTIVMANPAAAQMFHCRVDELVGAPLQRLIPERYRREHWRDVQAFGATETNARHMGRLRDVMGLRVDGEEFPIDAAISHLSVGGQRLYTVILRDITERRSAEAALRESEASLRRLLMLLPEAVFVHSGNRISFVNEAAQHLFGAGEAALLGRSSLELVHPDSIDIVKSRIRAMEGGALLTPLIEEKILRADGATRIVEATATRIEDRDEASILVIMRDVTELKLTQAALVVSHADLQRLVAAQDKVQEEERKRIARELHDDLQQTLAAIRIDLGAIGERLAADPASVAPILAELDGLASAAINSTRRIVNDLRPQMLEDLGLEPALEVLVAQFSQRTGIACHLDERRDAGERALESPAVVTCLYRVVQEALNNVAKHARASTVHVRLASAAHGGLVLRVSDDGEGMSLGDRRKADSFGLLGMHERVRALGGVLRIDSQPGAGTTVEVVVPGTDAAQMPAH